MADLIQSIARALSDDIATLNAISHNVANLNTPGYQPLDAQPNERPGGGVALGPVQTSGSNVELAEELTGTLLDLRTAQANIGVLRAQDELLGETLDLLA